jgi:hypothetical protein
MTAPNTYTCTDNLGVTGKFLWCQDPNSTPANAAVQVSWAAATINTFTWTAAATETVNCYALGAPAPPASGYLHSRSLTIDHTKCGSSDSTSFPVLVSLTNSTFKTVSNGGHIHNASGFDIVFAADAAGATLYPWEVEFYDGTNGVLVAWVQVPTVSHTADTVLYVAYDNASISTAQNTGSFSPANVWDSNYVGVWHLPNGTTLTANDSTSNSLNGTLTNTPTATAGQIDGAVAFVTSSSQYISLGSTAPLQLTGALTIEAWVHPTADNGRILSNLTLSSGYQGYDVYVNSGGVELQLGGTGGLHQLLSASVPLSATSHYVGTFDGTTTGIAYVNGVAGSPDTGFAGLLAGSTAYISQFGPGGSGFWGGWLDEVRLSKIARGADWILTEYNNQFGPGNIGAANFITFGAEI